MTSAAPLWVSHSDEGPPTEEARSWSRERMVTYDAGVVKWTKEQEEVEETIEARFKPWNGDPQDKPLFHYTSARGLAGIIESGEIWATHFNHMNDRSELRIGEGIALQAAKELLSKLRVETPQHFILSEFVRYEPQLRLTAISGVYLASLSECRDLLSQWRAYASDGAGYSMGFRRLFIPTEERPAAQAGVYLVRCEYHAEAFARRIQETLGEVATIFEEFTRKHNGRTDLFDAISHATLSIAYRRVAALIPSLKDQAFSEEKEWRLVVLPVDTDREHEIAKFRTDRGGLTPYVELGLSERVPPVAEGAAAPPKPRMDLDSVIVGPSVDPARAKQAARLLLAKHGYDPGLVSVSRAPYRGTLL